jgi:hypothetical protein
MSQHAHNPDQITETGQSQFAAIAEIVAVLRDDPTTDWKSVNITALRDHLVDMDKVTTLASVERTTNGLTITFDVTGKELVAHSIQRMVLAHSPMLQSATDWSVVSQKKTDGAIMQITVNSENDVPEVSGLGLFGLMTIGAHHQQHHLMIALGKSPH